MEQIKKLEPKFKVGDIVYYYDVLYQKIRQAEVIEIVEIEDEDIVISEFNNFYSLKAKDTLRKINGYYTKKELFETFEECKADRISRYERLLSNPFYLPKEIAEERLKKIKGQVEAL